jgi:predicted PP-loop superfamily ATPase
MSKIARNKTRLKQRIEQLEAQSEILKQELEGELVVTRSKIADIGKIVLGISGGLIFSAIVLSRLGSRKKQYKKANEYKSRKVYQRFRDQLAHELTSQATEFILGIVKDKLSAYAEKQELSEDEDTEITG